MPVAPRATSTLAVTSVDKIKDEVSRLRKTFDSHVTRVPAVKNGHNPIAFRREQLRKLYYMITDNKQEWLDALYNDLGKPPFETELEIMLSLNELINMLDHMEEWLEDTYPKVALPNKFLRARTIKDPLGIVTIITPFNFPIMQIFFPLVGALACGNCAIIKPSEICPTTANLWSKYLPNYVDPSLVSVVNGGVTEVTELLKQKVDYISYTGNGQVARIIMAAAAKNLTPVGLELGGKSPVIVCADADLKLAARRIVSGKVNNSGQACTSPDHILVDPSIAQELTKLLQDAFIEFFASKGGAAKSDDFGRIVNGRHFERISRITNGRSDPTDEATLFIPPTVVSIKGADDPLMSEEIFGPILPILSITLDKAIDLVNRGDTPLALYIFSKSDKTRKYIIDRTRSGSVVENDVMSQIIIPELPFGGVGESGIGKLRGIYSVRELTHDRAACYTPAFVERLIPGKYPGATRAQQDALLSRANRKWKYSKAVGSAGGGKRRPGSLRIVILATLIVAGALAGSQNSSFRQYLSDIWKAILAK